MRVNHVIEFFDDPDNRQEVRKICRLYFHNRDDADDVSQDIAEKLLRHPDSDRIPKERAQLLRFIVGMVINYRYDVLRRAQKLPPMVDESHARDVDSDTPPSIMQKMDKLNELIQKRSEEFTEDQMKLWHLMYLNEHVHVMALLLGKTANSIYQMRLKLIEKLGKLFKLDDLF